MGAIGQNKPAKAKPYAAALARTNGRDRSEQPSGDWPRPTFDEEIPFAAEVR